MRNKEQEMAWRKVIEACMEDVKHHFDDIQQAIEFGCYIQPDNYFVSYIFATDSQLETARRSGLTEQIPSYFKADTSNGINSTSLPLMVITLGKNRRLFPPVTETRSLWSSAACFAAGCCSLEKMVCSMEVFGGAMANETV